MALVSLTECRDYLYPLIQGEDYRPTRTAFPSTSPWTDVAVPKKLAAFSL